MKLVAALTILGIICHTSQALLQLGNLVPASFENNFRYGEYVKDRDDCRFGYRVDTLTGQVVDRFNCTKNDSNVFFSLKFHVCGIEDAIKPYTTETCNFTPLMVDADTQTVENDPNCANPVLGVAPDPTNCAKYIHCFENNRVGSASCPRGLYFSTVSNRCEYMWEVNSSGNLVSLDENFMCRGRPLPVNLRRNYGAIYTKCFWTWDFSNYNTYSVAEPLNCRFYYLCSRFNPTNIDTSTISQCTDPNSYWSDSRQACVAASLLSDPERRECIAT